MARWGIAATIKAPTEEILRFCAHHLDLGAARLLLYLDDARADQASILAAHPAIDVASCDAAYWEKRGRRPEKHQVRQTRNATHAYRRKARDLDWLIHMDVDEFLWPEADVNGHLDALQANAVCARVRPAEALADGDGTAYKAFVPPGPDRHAIVARLYGDYGAHVKGGFLSHVAGKLFVRTGIADLSVRIHNVFLPDNSKPQETDLMDVTLLHRHARGWDDWIAAYRYRLEHGSYRSELGPAIPRDKGGITLHEYFSRLEAEGGEASLRSFHDTVCADTTVHRASLEAEGLLRLHDLGLEEKRARVFFGVPRQND